MLEKLITNIKNSLPGAKKSAEGEEEEQNLEEGEETSSEEGESSSDPKQKQGMLIRVVVIIALGYLALDHFILNPEEEAVETVATPKPRRKRPKPEAAAEKPAEAVIATKSETTTTPPVEETAPPVENINITDKEAPSIPQEPTPPVEMPAVEPEPIQEPKVATGEKALDEKLDQLIDNVEKKSAESSNNMADKIVEEEVQTPPPSYEVLGRGLVYNCKDKHWACIDKPQYIACNKNMKWNKAKGNAQECVVQNVYNSEEDCIKVQKYNVSTNLATTFCQN